MFEKYLARHSGISPPPVFSVARSEARPQHLSVFVSAPSAASPTLLMVGSNTGGEKYQLLLSVNCLHENSLRQRQSQIEPTLSTRYSLTPNS